MDCTAVELGTLVRECVRQLSSVAATSGIELVSNELGVSPMLVHADRMRLKQVIDNLLSNAIKYSRAGGVITVSTREVDTTVELTVQDTGSGLSPEQLERIFIPFDRLGAEKTGVRGSGLGLALSKRLVELMGGSIRVSSRLGAGSAFIVTLPSSRGVRAAHP
jgi:signal transduction histidine kinase